MDAPKAAAAPVAVAPAAAVGKAAPAPEAPKAAPAKEAGAYTRPLFSST